MGDDMRGGTFRLDATNGQLLLKTGRTGLGRRAGHDLTIEVTGWEATATVNPADAGSSSVSVTIDVDSFAVREGAGGVKPLTDGDRAEIQRVVRQEILHTERHPTITFRSTRVRGTPDAFVVEGELTIRDVTQPVTVRGAVDGAGGGRVRGGATVTQSRFGIKPYSAFFGALKLADDVEVTFDVTLPGHSR